MRRPLLFPMVVAAMMLDFQSLYTQVLPQDSLALVDFYNATGGPAWTTNYNWLTNNPVSTWYGVSVSGNRVVQLLFLWGNNVVGAIPSSFGNLTGLQALYLGSNQITGLPTEIGSLTNLESLFLEYNQISSLPSTIGSLANLTQLEISGNQLTQFPDEVGNLGSLRDFSAEYNQLITLPTSIGNLANLQSLNLMDNQIMSVPQELGNLIHLQALYLGGNALTSLPAELFNLDSLGILWLWGNLLTSLPEQIGNLTQLRNLHLQANQLSTLPSTIGNLAALNMLHVGDNQLTALPTEIGNLLSLTSLRAFNNQLTSLPPEIGNLTSLTELWLQRNLLTTFPREIVGLVNLTHLWLDNNEIADSIPAQIGDLSNLVLLTLDGNRLVGAVPPSLANLQGLAYVFLWDNRLEDLPAFTGSGSLYVLNVWGNRLTFEDIEPNIGLPNVLFGYAPQDSVGIERDTTVSVGDTLTFVVMVGGTANRYQWMRDNIEIAGANASVFTIEGADTTDSGSYVCRVTNDIATELILYSRPVHLEVLGSVYVVERDGAPPREFALHQNYPNPFNPSTAIRFTIPTLAFVSLKVFNPLGQEITVMVNEELKPGSYEVQWNPTGYASGVYFYRLQAGPFSQTRRILLLR